PAGRPDRDGRAPHLLLRERRRHRGKRHYHRGDPGGHDRRGPGSRRSPGDVGRRAHPACPRHRRRGGRRRHGRRGQPAVKAAAPKAAAPKAAAPRTRRISRLSLDERLDQGRTARDRTPPSSHSGWRAATDRPDPVGLLERQDRTREPDLVPVRHGRMMVSPFTFYRGAAKIMAVDLKDTPAAGLRTQLCGDAHLSNFGMFASPERRLVFDLNDFDETLPGPFEYDVKRMAASFLIAGRNNGFAKADARAAAMASVTAYREAMADFARMPTMDIWYAHFDEDR